MSYEPAADIESYEPEDKGWVASVTHGVPLPSGSLERRFTHVENVFSVEYDADDEVLIFFDADDNPIAMFKNFYAWGRKNDVER